MGNGSKPWGFEDVLWKAADKLRGSMDASEYKHVVLGLIFLKYVEDAFEERRAALRDELAAEGIAGEAAEELLEGLQARPRRSCWSLGTSTPPRACSGSRLKRGGGTSVSGRSSRRSAS